MSRFVLFLAFASGMLLGATIRPKILVLDIDGLLVAKGKPMPGAAEFINHGYAEGYEIYYLGGGAETATEKLKLIDLGGDTSAYDRAMQDSGSFPHIKEYSNNVTGDLAKSVKDAVPLGTDPHDIIHVDNTYKMHLSGSENGFVYAPEGTEHGGLGMKFLAEAVIAKDSPGLVHKAEAIESDYGPLRYAQSALGLAAQAATPEVGWGTAVNNLIYDQGTVINPLFETTEKGLSTIYAAVEKSGPPGDLQQPLSPQRVRGAESSGDCGKILAP